MEILVPAPRLPFTADALRRWLHRELKAGPRVLDELAERLAIHLGRSVDEAAELIDVGLDDDGGMVVVGQEQDSVMLLENLVDGITFTHRITKAESETGVVNGLPDFVVALALGSFDDEPDDRGGEPGRLLGPNGLAWAHRPLADDPTLAHTLGSRSLFDRTIVGPPGWLRDATDGLVALTGTARAWRVTVVPASTPPAFDATLQEALRSELAALEGDDTARVVDVLLDGIAVAVGTGTNRTGWIEPVSDVAQQAARSQHQNLFGGPDIDWDAYDLGRAQEVFANIWAVTPVAAAAMMRTMDAVTARRRGQPTSEDGRKALLTDLATPGAVEGLVENVLRRVCRGSADGSRPEQGTAGADDFIDAAAEMLAAAAQGARGTARARIDWLRSRVEPEAAASQALLRSAVQQDPRFLPAHDDLVWFAAVNAFDGAGRAGLDHELEAWVSAGGLSKAVIQNRTQASPREILRIACSIVARGTVRNTGPSIGRNDPCPCGSGRKYKQCHNGKPLAADEGSPSPSVGVRSMVPWVQALQLLWFERTNQRYFREVVETLEEVPEGDQRNMITTFVIDADVSDSTRTEDFLATAVDDGATWPNGLATIVRSWAERPFGLYEVEDRVVGKTLWVRDLRTAERFVVEAPETSRHHGVGTMFLSRLVHNGDALQMSFGSIQVSLRDRERTLAMLDESNGRPDAVTLAHHIAGEPGTAGTRIMRNTDGDDIVIHRSLLRPSHPTTVDAVSAALAEQRSLQRADEEGGATLTWHVIGDGGLGQTIRGAIQVGSSADGVWLLVETNSVRRHGEALALSRRAIGNLDALDATVDDLDDRELAEDYAELGLDVPTITPLGLGEGSAPELTPEVMTEIALQMEERWMSEGVPALGGLTPRQAAVDPTRRGDLVALLSSFPPSMPGMITFDPQRLAVGLGVEIG